MRRFIPLKIFSWILLVLMLSVAINGMHASAHADQGHCSPSECHGESAGGGDAPPSSPFEHHQDEDGCDSCINCTCHAPLTVQPFQLSYSPIIMTLRLSDPFRHLPEVYLSKFIPPQNHA
jgi:hypothetical protein